LSDTVRGTVFGILAASIWGGMYVVSDVVLHTIPPFTLLSMRLLIGALILGVVLARRQQIRIARPDAIKLLGVGTVGFGVSLGAQFVGTHLATAINGAVITSASAAFIVLFAWLVLREPLTPIRIGAVLLASVGVLAILDLSHFDLSSSTTFGNIALIVAALTWALYSVLVRLVSKDYPTLTISFYAFIGGLIISLPASAIELGSQPIGEITVGVVLGVLYLGVISTALAMLLWNEAFALVEASRAALFFFAQPLVGVILATVLLHQPITIQLIVGGTLVILGVLVSIRADNPAPTLTPPEHT